MGSADDAPRNADSAQELEPSDEQTIAVNICPQCGHEFAVDAVPENGLVTCPDCGAEFFAVIDASDEDRAKAEQLELERQVREERLVDLRHNAVLLERRSLFRTRTYLVLALGVCVAIILQLGLFIFHRLSVGGITFRVAAYAAAIVGLGALSILCFRKIRELNAELAKPVQRDPVTPPDFSSLSDGSQYLDVVAGNLEKLSKK
jgi:hypothetical protein